MVALFWLQIRAIIYELTKDRERSKMPWSDPWADPYNPGMLGRTEEQQQKIAERRKSIRRK